ncbi:MAG: transporter related protein, partial [Ilumatobacteraceae bacterium]|nr:transporter related protein [Ilumatobacteraceae bacterium]
MTARLRLEHVSKVYGDGATAVHALRDVHLSVADGELVAIMGPSGSGKSSLLTIAGSLEDPSSGAVFVGEQSLTVMSRAEKARLRRRSIGFVFQDFNLLAGLTAAENVAMPLELDGITAREARKSAMSALEQLGIDERSEHFPDDLSGGERQRVAIARAIV